MTSVILMVWASGPEFAHCNVMSVRAAPEAGVGRMEDEVGSFAAGVNLLTILEGLLEKDLTQSS